MTIGASNRIQSCPSWGGSIINPTIAPIIAIISVTSAVINGNHALLVAKSQFATTPTTSNVGRIHQSVSLCSRVMVIATGASSHVMAYCAMMNSSTNPSKTQQKTPNPVPHAAGTSSIRMYILYFLPYPPNKFAPGAKRAALHPERCLWYAKFYCRSR